LLRWLKKVPDFPELQEEKQPAFIEVC
jgi:hypothetical protein